MALIVQKFGGSSVADAKKIQNVCNVISRTYDAGNDVVVVLSAQGDTTDDLIEKAEEINPNASKRDDPSQSGRWIKVSWGNDTNDSYPTTLEVVCKDRSNLLLDISAALSTTNTFVLGINSRSTEDEFAIFRIEVRMRDSQQLKVLMNKLHQISGVLKVTRPAG